MKFRFHLAAAAPLFLIPALWSASAQISMGEGALVQVRHHASPRRLLPAGSQYWITTPGLSAGVSRGYYYNNFQSYGASPGQPGSPTYAPYAGLPPLRYYGN